MVSYMAWALFALALGVLKINVFPFPLERYIWFTSTDLFPGFRSAPPYNCANNLFFIAPFFAFISASIAANLV